MDRQFHNSADIVDLSGDSLDSTLLMSIQTTVKTQQLFSQVQISTSSEHDRAADLNEKATRKQ